MNPGTSTVTVTGIGVYKVTVAFKNNYSGSKKTPQFVIVPKAPTDVTAQLYGYNDIKITWTKPSGASGYTVYYKKGSATSWTNLVTTTAASYKASNLDDGTKYTFKVVPYYKAADGAKYSSLKYGT